MQLNDLTFELPEVLAVFTDTPAPFLGTMSSQKVDLFKPGSGGQALLRVRTSPTPVRIISFLPLLSPVAPL